MEVITLPAWSDNYMYLLIEKSSKKCAAVDPVEPEKVLNAVKDRGLQLHSILTTHHHADHSGGNSELVKKWKSMHGEDLTVYGGDSRIPALNHTVSDGEKLKMGENLAVTCIYTPCHTSGHVCYHVTESGSANAGVVFTGDCLFLAGCGRFFEGTAQQMYKALVEKLATLPPATKVYCGHEYTVKNLEFALTVEPNNKQIQQRLERERAVRAQGKLTVPGSIEEELATNPFMRVNQPEVLSHAKTSDPIQAMKIIREEKDRF
ncbi:unnamed protein product [Calicophoron daubneyi]|uniref:hydroxyacylglutathione hydrolase n=1 Tax=Calicophoron daubneyi TaxID=300641 RepID=A0AAV2TUP0_CALDB